MSAKRILTLVLGAFVVVALFAIARQSSRPAQSEAPASASAVPLAVPPPSTSTEAQRAASLNASPDAASPVTPPAVTSGEPPSAASKNAAPTPAVQASAAAPVAPPAHARKIVATYFHGNVRCATCRKVEAYAREAVEGGFQSQVASGSVEFRAVNVEDAENRHFVQDFQLVSRSVVVTEEVDGAVARFVKLDNVWGLVGDRPAYLDYVQDAVRWYMEAR